MCEIDTETIRQYIGQNRTIYTREAITSQLVAAGYRPDDIEQVWNSLDPAIPGPPSSYPGAAGPSTGRWDAGASDETRPRPFVRTRTFWAYTLGFIVLSYLLPGIILWLGASQSDGTIVNIALGMFLLLQLGAIVGGLASLRQNSPRAAGLLIGMLMTVVVIPTCAVALFFGMCLASLGTFAGL